MNDQEQPTLSLGEAPKRLTVKTGGVPQAWLWPLLGLQLLVAAILIAVWLRSDGTAGVSSINDHMLGELKAAATALEDRSLHAEAARTWRAYLDANLTDPQRAQILYRAGKLAFKAEDFSQAVTLLVQSEQSADDDSDLKAKIGPLVVDCLRQLGRYGEVGRELSRRVETGGDQTDQGKVLATLAGENFTEADLDRMIERRVDQMLSAPGATGDAAQRNALVKQLSSTAMRRQMLEEFLQTELFVRRARELKLDRTDGFLRARRFLVENLLAAHFLADEIEKIQPTDVDIEAYYKANQQQYEEPKSMAAVLLELGDQEDAKAVLEKVESADKFKKLAAERTGKADSKETIQPHRIVHGRSDSKLGDVNELFKLSVDNWTKEPHTGSDRKRFLVLCDVKTPARTPPLSQIRWRVEADYRARKRREISDRLYRDLMARFDVKVLPIEASDSAEPHGKLEQSDEQDQEP